MVIASNTANSTAFRVHTHDAEFCQKNAAVHGLRSSQSYAFAKVSSAGEPTLSALGPTIDGTPVRLDRSANTSLKHGLASASDALKFYLAKLTLADLVAELSAD
jgi:hypothetical protein